MQKNTPAHTYEPLAHIAEVVNGYGLSIAGDIEIERFTDDRHGHDVISYVVAFEDHDSEMEVQRIVGTEFTPYVFQQQVEIQVRAFLGCL